MHNSVNLCHQEEFRREEEGAEPGEEEDSDLGGVAEVVS